jgi:hypothetical protein
MLRKGNFEPTERDFVVASALVRHGGEVHAFEPSGESYSRLMNNIKIDGYHNVTVNRVALLAHRIFLWLELRRRFSLPQKKRILVR